MFITNSLSGGGAERATNILVNILNDAGLPVSLVVINESDGDLITPRCKVFELKRQWRGGLRSIFSSYFQLLELVKRWSPEVIVLNCDAPELLGSLLVGKHTTVVVEHTSQPWNTRKALGRIVRCILRFRNTKWIAVSSHLKVWPKNIAPDRYINNAISIELAIEKNFNDQFFKAPNQKIHRLVFVGRLSKEKQPELVLDIAKRTKIPAIFFGDGMLREFLLQKCSDYGVEAVFTGFVKNPWGYIRPGDLLIVSSTFEGDGLVLVEALANGIPILVNAVPDLLRFNLPGKNYCSSLLDFEQRINDYSHNLFELQVPSKLVKRITNLRSPIQIAEKWRDFLSLLT